MAKPEWGVKRQCANCGARFYDLMLDPITCPECGTVYEVAALVRGKRTRTGAGRVDPIKKAVVLEDVEELDIDVEIDDDAEEDDVVLDDEADEADDVAVPAGPAAVEIDDEDDALGGDDAVLIEDEDEDDVALEPFPEEEDEDPARR